MKKLKKILVIFLITIILTPMIVSSKENKKVCETPEKSIEIFLDVVLKDKKDEMSKIGITEEDYEQIKEELKSELTEDANSIFSINKDVITEEIVSLLNKSIISGISKVDYEANQISQTKSKAEVELSIRGLDLKEIIQKTEDEFIQSQSKKSSTLSQSEMTQEIFKIWAKYLEEGIIVDNPTLIKVTLTRNGDYWFVDEKEMEKVGETLFS
ncbi:hypothetical protein UT300005_22640 [Clostridium sp. CTA-5]